MFDLSAAAFASGESMYLRVASCYRALQVCVRVIVVSARRVSLPLFGVRRSPIITEPGASVVVTEQCKLARPRWGERGP